MLGRHTGIPGIWTQVLDAGLWTLASRRWTLDAGRWTLDPGCWTLDARPQTLDSGRWTLDATLWRLGSGHRTLFENTDSLSHCFRTLDTVSLVCFRTESESSFWFFLIKLLKILLVRISKDLMVTLVLQRLLVLTWLFLEILY